MNFIVTTFVLFIFYFFNKNFAFNAENYINYIEELSHDDKFLEEYTKWSSELFSQPDYIYGNSHAKFPCLIDQSNDTNSIPISVHKLRPSDIKCIAAMGDSFTTGLAARAITPIDLLFEDRGISWSIGGDYTYSKIVTIPNILREYNPKVKGFSMKGYLISTNTFVPTNRLNVAKSGDLSNNILQQAEVLIERLTNEKFCDWNNDWKLITIFVGRNDLCHFCKDSSITKHTSEQYITYIRDTLDKLYNAPIPRTFINLVLTSDIRDIKDLNNSNYVCQTLLKKLCPCAVFSTEEQMNILNDYILQYQQGLVKLINSGRYDRRNDFTVVIQPFMSKMKLFYKNNNQTDFSYLAPDCFHFSGKGHSQAAFSLWNNMFEPIGNKQESWHINQSLKCPTKKYPFIFTSKNSINTSIEIQTTTELTTRVPIISNTTNNPISTINSNSTLFINITSNQTSTINNNITSISDDNTTNSIFTSDISTSFQRTRKYGKDKKNDLNSSFSKLKFIVIIGFLFILIMILIVGFFRRRKTTIFVTGGDRYNVNYTNDDMADDDIEVYTRPKQNTTYYDDKEMTTTHGTRISFE